jgi:hypothetical protein
MLKIQSPMIGQRRYVHLLISNLKTPIPPKNLIFIIPQKFPQLPEFQNFQIKSSFDQFRLITKYLYLAFYSWFCV